MNKPTDFQIMKALMDQVRKAVPLGGSERDVTTIISRPMWQAWCRAVDMPENSEPTEWLGIHKTMRVYGSRTIVVENPKWLACSGYLSSHSPLPSP
jgi:hypothetical protein